MNFSSYIFNHPKIPKEKFCEYLKQFGEPTEIISYIDRMQTEFCSKSMEIAIDERFFVLKTEDSLRVHPTSALKYYYASADSGEGFIPKWRSHEIGIVLENHRVFTYRLNHREHLEQNAIMLSKFVKGFESTKPTYREMEIDEIRGKMKINAQQLLVVKQKNFFKKNNTERIILKIEPITDIIWCEQFNSYSSESWDTFGLDLYLINGKKHTISIGEEKINPDSEKIVFDIALCLKSNIPHLLYGINSEYKRIFKENPAKLLEIAKKKCSE